MIVAAPPVLGHEPSEGRSGLRLESPRRREAGTDATADPAGCMQEVFDDTVQRRVNT